MLTVQNYEQKIAPTDANITIHIIGDVLADVRVEKRFLLPIDMKPLSLLQIHVRNKRTNLDRSNRDVYDKICHK